MASFIEAVLKAKVLQICNHVGYNAITLDSANILVDIYRRSFIHLARHCKEAANNNRRVEPTLIDLIQAYDFVGISIAELQEYVKNVQIPFDKEIEKVETRPSNRIQRDLLVDDILDAKKGTNSADHDEDGENKLSICENGTDEEEQPKVPLLKDIYQDIAKQFPSPSTPIKADKLKIKREVKPAIPRLKITPLDPAVAEPPSFLPLLDGSNEEGSIPVTIKTSQATPSKDGRRGPKGKTKIRATKATKAKNKTKLKTKIKTKLKTKIKGKKSKIKIAPAEIPQQDLDLPPSVASPLAPTPPIVKPPTPLPEPSPRTRTPVPSEDSQIKTPNLSTPSTSASKQSSRGKKKKKKSNSQFAIITESVTKTRAAEESEWLCPVCHGPDNGDLMLQCEGKCELWFHLKCTGLKKEPKDDEKYECNICIKPQSKLTGKQSSKGSKKRDRIFHDSNVKIESRTPTPQSPAPVRQQTPPPITLGQPISVIQSAIVDVKQQSPDEQPQASPLVVCGLSDDLCPECQLPDDGTLMIQCDDPFCAKWFHGKCVNVLSAPEDNDSWFCKVCVDKQQSAFKRRRRVK